MRQSIRALGWTITIVTLLTFIFLGFSLYSLVQLVMAQGITAGDWGLNVSNGNYVISIPFSVNNTSYFDITELGVTTIVKDLEGEVISYNTTSFGSIPRRSLANRSHNIIISIDKMMEKNLTYILFTDCEIYMDTVISLRYANVIGFNVSMMNVSIPLRAPVDLSIGEPDFQLEEFLIEVPFTLTNQSPISIEGAVSVSIYNQDGTLLGSGSQTISVRSESTYSGRIEIRLTPESLRHYKGSGYLEIRFENPMFSFKWPRVPYG
ncbi:MAG: hypothetical protein ACE5NN_02165 [Candidatus Bathyarchaeia archaeon]